MLLKEILKQRVDMKTWNIKEQGFHYDCPEDFVLQEGTNYDSQEISPEELEHFNTVFKKSKNNKNRECFYNAQMLTLLDDTGGIEYWEGFTNKEDLPILHGFNVINGKVIDVTHKVNGKPILGVFTNKEYIGIKFSKNRILERIRNGQDSTSFIDDFRGQWPVLNKKWSQE